MQTLDSVSTQRVKFPHICSALSGIAFLLFTLMTPMAFAGVPAPPLVINEIRIDQPGSDIDEYFELAGDAAGSLDGVTYLVIGDSSGGGSGVIESVTSLTGQSIPASGFFVAAENTFTLGTADLTVSLGFENSDNVTHMLVSNFTGANGDDLDTDDDGTLDATPWDSIVDCVALIETPGSGEQVYCATGVGPDGSFVPGHVINCPAGWIIGDFAPSGGDTPGLTNNCGAVSSGLVINEIDYDQSGTDAAEFIEIMNTGDSVVDLDGYSLVLINGSGGGAVVYNTLALPAATLASGDYFVVCGDSANVLNCDLDVAPNTNLIQNGAPDAVALLLNSVIVDTVSYEGDTGSPYTEGSGAGLADFPSNDLSGISRFPDGTDTDMNNVDLSPRCITPGAANMADNSSCTGPVPSFGACGDEATFIHEVQGSGMSSPIVGTAGVIIEGVVVGDFQAGDQLRGFFLQEEDFDADGDPQTSDGIFVSDNGFGPDVEIGVVVRVQGTVTENFGQTEIRNINNMEDCLVMETASAVAITLPQSAVADWERTEGMALEFPQTLYASGNFNQARFGEVDLAVGAPLDNPTNVVLPGAPAIALQAINDVSRILLDDGSNVQNPLPLPPYLGVDNTLRTGDSVSGLKGALGYSFGNYRLQPTAAVNFVRENDRPAGPPDVGGSLLTVAGFNVLNYFTTLDDSGPICGPDGDQGCRGADNADEFDRQKTKLVAALTTLDADVTGLIELENAADDTPIADLVDGLNAVAGAGTYAYIPTSAIGADAIRQGLVYKPSTVTPVGGFEVLDSSVDPDFLDQLNRPVLAQTFEENTTGERFTVAVNHLKSKGSDCNDEGDPDMGDGQGNCNMVRTTAAIALVDWLATDPTGSGDPDFLLIGDLNAYAMEDPVVAIEIGGYEDLIKTFVGTGVADGAYSFNFGSQSGYLDHALSTPGLALEVSGTTAWHINADEPRGLDYNDFNQPGLFNPDQFRASDHDAIVVGLLLDEDEDGVWDEIDECPGTVIPESVPAIELGTNRFALVDDDRIFDTKLSNGKGRRVTFDIFDTAGCSCEQIIDEQELGKGHTKYGCSLGEMKEWVELVYQP